jgi:acid phosphatase
MKSLLCLALLAFVPKAAQAARSLADIQHVFVVIFENTNAMDSKSQPFMKSLISKGAYLNNYHAIAHPSLPNYVALIAGDTMGVDDNGVYHLRGKHLGDLLEAAGKSWKLYAEDYPGGCFKGSKKADYVRRHNPFMNFTNIESDPDRCQSHIVNAHALDTDIANGTLPHFSFFVPGVVNDGHDTGVAHADQWLETTFGPKLQDSKFMSHTLFLITFDENDPANDVDDNLIYTLLLGEGVRAGAVSEQLYSHYSLLRLVEDIFHLGNLGRKDAQAPAIQDIWLR